MRLFKFRKKLWITILSATLVGAVILFGFFFKEDPQPAYETALVARGNIERTVLATGILEPYKKVEVGTQVTGRLKSLSVALGDRVVQGQLLAEIDDVVARTKLEIARAEYDRAFAQTRGAQADLNLAQWKKKRQLQLEAVDSTSGQEVEIALTQVDLLQAKKAELQAQLRKTQLEVSMAQAELDYTRINAPIAGEVSDIKVLEGQTVNAAQQAPTILSLADLSLVTVKSLVSEVDVLQLKVGMLAYFTVLGDAQRRYEGQVRMIEPTPETLNNAKFFHVLFDVPNVEGLLKQGMTAQVSIVVARAQQVLFIPATALKKLETSSATVEILDKEGLAKPRKIRIGLNNRLQVEVREGLSLGERVVLPAAIAENNSRD